MSLSIESLKRVLDMFCSSAIEYKSLRCAAGAVNYIEIRKQRPVSTVAHPVKQKTLIMLHGFGAGLGFFFNNFDALANNTSPFDRIVAIDWPGMGHSQRDGSYMPRRSVCDDLSTSVCKPSDGGSSKVDHSIEYFTDALNQWQQEDMSELRSQGETDHQYFIAGHSLGGYLVANYALKHPKMLAGLILISPVGLQGHPSSKNVYHPLSIEVWKHWGIRAVAGLTLAEFSWKLNITPQTLLRMSGKSYSEKMLHNYVAKRFVLSPTWSDEQKATLSRYMHEVSLGAPNGEYALNSLLMPRISFRKASHGAADGSAPKLSVGVYARNSLSDSLANIEVPVLLQYGDNDWLHYPEVTQDVQRWKRQGLNIDLDIIPQAGHHLYLDNSDYFQDSIISWTNRLLLGEAGLAGAAALNS